MRTYSKFFTQEVPDTVKLMQNEYKLLQIELENKSTGLQKLYQTTKLGYPLLNTMVKIALCFGASSAEAERAFSGLDRIETDRRTTMSQERLSSLSIIHMNRGLIPSMDEVIDECSVVLPRLNIYI